MFSLHIKQEDLIHADSTMTKPTPETQQGVSTDVQSTVITAGNVILCCYQTVYRMFNFQKYIQIHNHLN